MGGRSAVKSVKQRKSPANSTSEMKINLKSDTRPNGRGSDRTRRDNLNKFHSRLLLLVFLLTSTTKTMLKMTCMML